MQMSKLCRIAVLSGESIVPVQYLKYEITGCHCPRGMAENRSHIHECPDCRGYLH
jgi:hypothetical protein